MIHYEGGNYVPVGKYPSHYLLPKDCKVQRKICVVRIHVYIARIENIEYIEYIEYILNTYRVSQKKSQQ